MEAVRGHVGAAGAPPAGATPAQAESRRQVRVERLADPRKPRGIRHSLASLVSVLVAGVACGYASILAITVAAAGWDREVLAAHGVRRNPQTGEHEPPSASTLGRVPALLDADELEAGLSGWIAAAALGPRLAARVAARRPGRTNEDRARPPRKPPAAWAVRPAPERRCAPAAPGDTAPAPTATRPPPTRSPPRPQPTAGATARTRGRTEPRPTRPVPAPQEPAFPRPCQAILIERYVTVKKNGTWVMRNCEAVLYITSLAAGAASPEDLLAHIRGH